MILFSLSLHLITNDILLYTKASCKKTSAIIISKKTSCHLDGDSVSTKSLPGLENDSVFTKTSLYHEGNCLSHEDFS